MSHYISQDQRDREDVVPAHLVLGFYHMMLFCWLFWTPSFSKAET